MDDVSLEVDFQPQWVFRSHYCSKFFLKQDFMSSSNSKPSDKRFIYREFGNDNSAAIERPIPELPPQQQNLRVQATRSGRKGKTVTVISGFQVKPETLADLVKQLKTQCGTGGTVKENEIEIQGEHKQKILDILTKLGYKAKISGG
jgi:translation initiation factor 1